ncbi:MAG: SAM-dependent methyltransferase [Alphaproteobacteria bacterium]|nr:MAG: SAM-dependent methyltransferase [Alphaproteobacteria bacterium]PZO33397.1 MAG: SAM-dependent methyltransferase [Alphaproteobacteria bacterium]
MDPTHAAPTGGLVSPAAARNAEAILAILQAHLPQYGRVLEIASGSGQHAVAFARDLPEATWIPSDPSAEARDSILAWRQDAGLPNLAAPLPLDAMDPATWPTETVQAIVCINMIHISPWSATEGLMALAGKILTRPGGLLFLYGPYREADQLLAPSNASFDADLKGRDPAWGLRDRDDVAAEARKHGLHLTLRKSMPANNIALLFRRT